MSRIQLLGVDGSSPLGFLAALGVLRVIPDASLSFREDGTFQAVIDGSVSESDLIAAIAADAERAASNRESWYFSYTKAATKKQGPMQVADLKSSPADFKRFLSKSVEKWLKSNQEHADYAAAYATDVAIDGKGNTKPTAFHFTAAQQTFLGTVEGIRASITRDWIEESLFSGHGYRSGGNLRWDPSSERSWALMANNPNDEGTRVNAPLEWLAFRALPFLPCFPRGSRITTTGVTGRGDSMSFVWPLWSVPASRYASRSLLQLDWASFSGECLGLGIFAVCSSSIWRSSQGFGNFRPSSIIC